MGLKTILQINDEIAKLKDKIKIVKGSPCEVYTRIIGYYRQVGNWNKGKREEYNNRLPFDTNKSLTNHQNML